MKRNNKYKFKEKKKRNSKGITIGLIIMAIISTSLVTWIGLNNWDIEKSFNQIGVEVALPDREKVKEPEDFLEKPSKSNEEELIEENKVEDVVKEEQNLPVTDSGGYIEGQELPSEPTYIQGILIASKKYPLPATYAPGEDKEARSKYEEMAAEAKLSGYSLVAFSTYRSFEYQQGLYKRYVDKDGREAADRYSARPGYSEHQTGLTFDIGEENEQDLWLTAEFGESEAGKWLASNAHRYGFIMRYPLGKEEITGYMYESWHYRYVGEEVATELYQQKITLEEYLGI
ncbi:M15 family metallopeptidase [Sporosarcina sp. CAU 1771]